MELMQEPCPCTQCSAAEAAVSRLPVLSSRLLGLAVEGRVSPGSKQGGPAPLQAGQMGTRIVGHMGHVGRKPPGPTPAGPLASLTASRCCRRLRCFPRAEGWGQVPLTGGTGVAAAPHGWGSPSFTFCLFCLSAPRPLLFCTPPARAAQPTDERSWVYSPLHYSARPASDGESDTVSPQVGWED